MFSGKSVLKICSKFTGEDPCRSVISIKLQSEGVWPLFQSCLIRIDLQDVSHFNFLILSNTILCNFIPVFWLATLAFIFPAIYLVSLLGGVICICIFKSSVLFFVEIRFWCLSSSFWECCICSSWSQFTL